MSGALVVSWMPYIIRITSSLQCIFWILGLGSRDVCSQRLYHRGDGIGYCRGAAGWLRWHQRATRVTGYNVDSLSKVSWADKGSVINSCPSCIALGTLCWCSKAVTKADQTEKMYFAGLILLMLLEERKPKSCFCTSESIASDVVPERKVLCTFCAKHEKLNCPS